MITHRFRFITTATLGCSLMLLSACGSSSTSDLEGKLERAEQAAQRAEIAQAAAEKAAQKAVAFSGRSSSSSRDSSGSSEQGGDKNALEPESITPDNNLDTSGG